MILHAFTMGDCEDPYLYAAQPIWEWQQTEKGKWVMENVTEPPVFYIQPDPTTFGQRVIIDGTLNPEAETFFRLKYK
jgi:hypothetical protein